MRHLCLILCYLLNVIYFIFNVLFSFKRWCKVVISLLSPSASIPKTDRDSSPTLDQVFDLPRPHTSLLPGGQKYISYPGGYECSAFPEPDLGPRSWEADPEIDETWSWRGLLFTKSLLKNKELPYLPTTLRSHFDALHNDYYW